MEPSQCYQIINHANGMENIFVEEKIYDFFLQRLAYHILPVCRMYAFCLMKNHFHLLVRIRSTRELDDLWSKQMAQNCITNEMIIKKISKHSLIFSAVILRPLIRFTTEWEACLFQA